MVPIWKRLEEMNETVPPLRPRCAKLSFVQRWTGLCPRSIRLSVYLWVRSVDACTVMDNSLSKKLVGSFHLFFLSSYTIIPSIDQTVVGSSG